MGPETFAGDFDVWEAKGTARRRRGGIFGPMVDPRTYGTIAYMLLSLVTGVAYFAWVAVGLSVSLGLVVVLIGIPLLFMFLMSVRLAGVVEGWIVQGLLGVSFPEGPGSVHDLGGEGRGFLAQLADPRTWSTIVYMLLMLPLGIAYFTVAVTGFATSLGLMAGAAGELISGRDLVRFGFDVDGAPPVLATLAAGDDQAVMLALLGLAGAVGFVAMFHLVRGIGWVHGRFARALLVRE